MLKLRTGRAVQGVGTVSTKGLPVIRELRTESQFNVLLVLDLLSYRRCRSRVAGDFVSTEFGASAKHGGSFLQPRRPIQHHTDWGGRRFF
jgi:hypothetical protein